MKFYHHINYNNKGGCTIAYDLIEHQQGKTLTFSVGFCSHKDTFCKKRGRDAAIKQWVVGNKISMVYKNKKKALRLGSLALILNNLFYSIDY